MSTLSLSLSFLSTRTSACPLHKHRAATTTTHLPSHCRLPRVSCHQETNNDSKETNGSQRPSLILDRRNVLVALGGLYGATNKMALANPLVPPDLSTCHDATSCAVIDPNDSKCCPPYTSANIVDYNYPKTPLRVRRAAHLVADDREYMDKYNKAVRKMKDLPDTDPWSYSQQAKIHCAYCCHSYDQAGFPNQVPIQVHGSWFFGPWHRYYLHFYERILGKLIGDDTFALPFWNWDAPDGMTFPTIFTDEASAIYNEARDRRHMPPAVIDLNYAYSNQSNSDQQVVIDDNLKDIRSAFRNSLHLAELFMGDPLRAGEPTDQSQASGRLETLHNAVHNWVGRPECPYADMGNFVTAARDSVFFSHHANVDRLWHLYHNFRGSRPEFTDNDWLDSAFIFSDENRQIVRVKVRDSLNISKFRYTYEEVPLPWRGKVVRRPLSTKTEMDKQQRLVPVSEFGSEPRRLDSPIRVLVSRPKKNRSKSDKEDKVEVLFIEGIQVNTSGPARFDVYIAAPTDSSNGEYAGNYSRLPHGTTDTPDEGMDDKKGVLKLGITRVIEDLEADDAEKLVVTVVPRFGDVTIGGIAINLLDTDNSVPL